MYLAFLWVLTMVQVIPSLELFLRQRPQPDDDGSQWSFGQVGRAKPDCYRLLTPCMIHRRFSPSYPPCRPSHNSSQPLVNASPAVVKHLRAKYSDVLQAGLILQIGDEFCACSYAAIPSRLIDRSRCLGTSCFNHFLSEGGCKG